MLIFQQYFFKFARGFKNPFGKTV